MVLYLRRRLVCCREDIFGADLHHTWLANNLDLEADRYVDPNWMAASALLAYDTYSVVVGYQQLVGEFDDGVYLAICGVLAKGGKI